MRLLAIDTSAEACSAALADDQRICSRFEIAPRRHAELILPMIDALLAEAHWSPAALDGLAFGCGPGAFTGVRVAAGVIQGMALGTDLPVAPIPTLAALAHGAWRVHGWAAVIAALDARMHEVYIGAWRCGDTAAHAVLADAVGEAAAVALPEDGSWHGAGSGWGAYQAVLGARLGARALGHDATLAPHAHDVAVLGLRAFAAGAVVSAEHAAPVYLRDRVTARP